MIKAFCADAFIVTFLSSLLNSGNTSVLRSSSEETRIVGSLQPCCFQTEKIFGKPLPARSPISIRLNIFIIVPLRGSEMPPEGAAEHTIKGLDGGVSYEVRVRAYVTTLLLMQVETNIYGEYSDPLTVAVP